MQLHLLARDTFAVAICSQTGGVYQAGIRLAQGAYMSLCGACVGALQGSCMVVAAGCMGLSRGLHGVVMGVAWGLPGGGVGALGS